MITKVVHGWRPAGLLAYLLGPGTAEVHVNPRVIASWDGLNAGWQPERTGPSPYDLKLGPLIAAMHAPAVAAGLPTRTPSDATARGKRGYVWHCSVRVAASDRVLDDGEWAAIARELLDAAGVAVAGDAAGPRWVAVRHADDHIHIAVVLVRQDTGRRFWPHQDYPKLRAAARRIEQRLGLTVTATADGTAAKRPTRGETEKAERSDRVPARVELRQAAQRAAVAADNLEDFVACLRGWGYLVELRRAPSGDLLGYKLARPGDTTAAGDPIFYSGSKLAADLSLPRLQRRWAGVAAGAGVTAGESAVDAVGAARAALADRSEDEDGIVTGAAELLAALSRGRQGKRWETVAERGDRACRSPYGHETFPGPAALGLRHAARVLLRTRGQIARDLVGGVALVVAVAGLLTEIAALQESRGRAHQAAAARAAAADATGVFLDYPDPSAGGGATRRNRRERGAARPHGGSARTRSRQIGDPTMTLLSPPAGPSAARSVDRS